MPMVAKIHVGATRRVNPVPLSSTLDLREQCDVIR